MIGLAGVHFPHHIYYIFSFHLLKKELISTDKDSSEKSNQEKSSQVIKIRLSEKNDDITIMTMTIITTIMIKTNQEECFNGKSKTEIYGK